MANNPKKVYKFFLGWFLFFFVLFSVFSFIFMPPMNRDAPPEGYFIVPGGAGVEQGLIIVLLTVNSFIMGFLTIYIFQPIILRRYLKSLSNEKKIGLVPKEELSNRELFLQIWMRAMILGFFILNICYTLASQDAIINYWRSVNPDPKTTMGLMKPDPGVMFGLTIIICIPCTFIIIPIWTMKDSGLVVMEKVKGVDFSTINPAGSRTYKIIKGFAGVGFIYNFTVLIITWGLPVMFNPENKTGEAVNTAPLMYLTPLMIISLLFPLIIYIELIKDKIRENTEKILKKLDMFQEFIYTVELKKIN